MNYILIELFFKKKKEKSPDEKIKEYVHKVGWVLHYVLRFVDAKCRE
jgi:hypothetical protein